VAGYREKSIKVLCVKRGHKRKTTFRSDSKKVESLPHSENRDVCPRDRYRPVKSCTSSDSSQVEIVLTLSVRRRICTRMGGQTI